MKYCEYDFHGLFLDDNLIEELGMVKKYKFIAENIKHLESPNLSTEEQINVIKSCLLKVDNNFLKLKFEKLLSKNPDLVYFMKFSQINV